MPSAVLTIEGEPVALACLRRRPMSLSSSKAGQCAARFKVTAERAPIVGAIAASYEECVVELKRDDSITGGTDFFGRAGYPPLEALLEMPALLSEVVVTYFEDEMYGAVLVAKPPEQSGTYFIDKTESVKVHGEWVVIEGLCYGF